MIPFLRRPAPVHISLEKLSARHRLSDGHRQRLCDLLTSLRLVSPGCQVRLNRNHRVMLSLRGRPSECTLSLHQELLEDERVLALIPAWLKQGGRRTPPELRQGLQRAWERQHQVAAADKVLESQALEMVGGPLNLHMVIAKVHSTWFAHLTMPAITWSRASAHRRLTHIRFACYKRSPSPVILVNPRLDQPWIARVFIEHVVYHELCHHAQASTPIRGEKAHSPRFRSWERQYPEHERALAWEHVNLRRLLDESGLDPSIEATGTG